MQTVKEGQAVWYYPTTGHDARFPAVVASEMFALCDGQAVAHVRVLNEQGQPVRKVYAVFLRNLERRE